MAHPAAEHVAPLNSQEQRSSSCSTILSTSTPTLIQEPEEHECSSNQHQVGNNESADQGDHSLSQLDLSEDDGETPPILHAHIRPAKPVELPITTTNGFLEANRIST
jgi:hypothetical protein